MGFWPESFRLGPFLCWDCSLTEIMDLLSEREAEVISGGRRGAMARGGAPMASLLRGLLGLSLGGGLGIGGRGPMGMSDAITTNVNQINLAFNIVLNGGSIVNNQLNGLDLSIAG
jgi:hypothetical protein